ncbi:hypothetical protein RJ639_002919 [Escallonia herrerae]|uniref:Uncharacterized protein n=1 Tax=Escallonia herrerae TaxID=1293975 RepID=A0AA89B0T1_9ASTE|nr:hypothetical protein RJ639_002919 [Escallonia herrerae]
MADPPFAAKFQNQLVRNLILYNADYFKLNPNSKSDTDSALNKRINYKERKEDINLATVIAGRFRNLKGVLGGVMENQPYPVNYSPSPISSLPAPRPSRHLNFPIHRTQHPPPHLLGFSNSRQFGEGQRLYQQRSLRLYYGAIDGGRTAISTSCSASSSSVWDDGPYEVLPSGKRAYLDEEDVVTFLDPPKELIPLDPTSYNPAAYLWKKIGEIQEERRIDYCPCSSQGSPRLATEAVYWLISRAWEIAGTKYEDPKLAKKSASTLLSNGDDVNLLEFWNCRTSGGHLLASLWTSAYCLDQFQSYSLFGCGFLPGFVLLQDGKQYGRLYDGSLLAGFSSSFPLYFVARKLTEVMSTEQPCDLAYEFGDGLLNLHDYPKGFPKPAKHPWPFSDQVVIYVLDQGYWWDKHGRKENWNKYLRSFVVKS